MLKHINQAYKITFIYLVVGILWIIFSDRIILFFFNDPLYITKIQTYKGIFYVIISSLLIFFLVYKEIKRKNSLIKFIEEYNRFNNIIIENIEDFDILLIDKDYIITAYQGKELKKFLDIKQNIGNKILKIIENNSEFSKLKNIILNNTDSKKTEIININDQKYQVKKILTDDKEYTILIFKNITYFIKIISSLEEQKQQIENLNKELHNSKEKLEDILQKMTESEKKYRTFYDNINDGAFILNYCEDWECSKFIDVNQKMTEILGFSREEFLKMSISDVTKPEEVSKIKNIFSQFSSFRHQYIEINFISKKNRVIPIELSFHLYEEDGKNMIFATARDIRERIKFIKKLEKARKKAEESDRLKSAFLANISHEIRTPMNGIIGFSELLCQEDISLEQRKMYINYIRKSSDQLLAVINDILDISRLEIGELQLYENEFSLNSLIDYCYEHLKEKILESGKNINIKTYKDKKENEDFIIADQRRIQQILENLIDNAYKFTKEGEINFGYKLNDNLLELFVEDSGIGIPKDKISIIFESFRQIDYSHSREYGGTGLGLAIVKGLVNLMHGSIEVKSELNKGTLFNIKIPIKTTIDKHIGVTEKLQLDTYKQEEKIINPEEKTVVIVEDNKENAELLIEYATTLDLKTIKFYKGSEVVEFIKKNKNIDLILMDIRLPDVNGLEVTKRLLKINPNLKIIAQTAFASFDDKMKCLKAGCIDYISKPISYQDFVNIIRKYLS